MRPSGMGDCNRRAMRPRSVQTLGFGGQRPGSAPQSASQHHTMPAFQTMSARHHCLYFRQSRKLPGKWTRQASKPPPFATQRCPNLSRTGARGPHRVLRQLCGRPIRLVDGALQHSAAVRRAALSVSSAVGAVIADHPSGEHTPEHDHAGFPIMAKDGPPGSRREHSSGLGKSCNCCAP